VLDYRPLFEFLRTTRLQKREQQIVRIASDRKRLPVIVAHDLAAANERFWHALNRSPPGFRLERIGGVFFSLPHADAKDVSRLRSSSTRVRLVPAISTATLTIPVSARAFRNRFWRSRVSLSFFIASGANGHKACS
jgi:hypothetical protein